MKLCTVFYWFGCAGWMRGSLRGPWMTSPPLPNDCIAPPSSDMPPAFHAQGGCTASHSASACPQKSFFFSLRTPVVANNPHPAAHCAGFLKCGSLSPFFLCWVSLRCRRSTGMMPNARTGKSGSHTPLGIAGFLAHHGVVFEAASPLRTKVCATLRPAPIPR